MNWGKAKTILIIIFLITDIILATTIKFSNVKSESISPEIIDSTIQILNKHNITVNKELIPTKNPSLRTVEADNVIDSYDDFSKKLLGTNAVALEENRYTSELGTVHFNGDTFSFKTSKNDDSIYIGDVTEKSVQDFLLKIGFVFNSPVITISKIKDTSYTVLISENIKDIPVFSSKVTVEIENEHISLISGKWFNIRENFTGQDSALKSITGILVDFISLYNSTVPCEIKSLELGYTIFETDTFHKSATLIPVQKITISSGKEYFIDSRNTD